jgi:hypothetical protein
MEYLARVWEQLAGRLEGPFAFRFVLQPLMATILAIRAGVADAQDHRTPYLWSVLSDPGERPQLIRDGFKDVTRVFVFGIVMDVLYQLIVFRWVYPLQSLLVASVLAIVPYVLIRGPVTRLKSRGRG